ncbi:hypothetical protein [Aquirufa salirivi]|uniref:Uncharacterized protein n=1 Tax=Aquirufa salirivi TaxID=3104729 RepID=A0ABW8RXF4_9BACT
MPNLISRNDFEPETFIDYYFKNNLNFSYQFPINNLKIFKAIDDDYTYLKLTDEKNELLSAIRLKATTFFKTEFYCISKSKSIFEGKGYATILYEYCFNNLDLPIISDKYQTKKGSSDLWLKLINKNRSYRIYLYYTKTNKYVELSKGFNQYMVWGQDKPKFDESPINYDNPGFEPFDFSIDELEDIDSIYPGPINLELISFTKNKQIKNRINVRIVVKR